MMMKLFSKKSSPPTRSSFRFWKRNSNNSLKNKEEKRPTVEAHTSSFNFLNVTFNVQIKDIFGFGILSKTFLLIIDSNYKFLERQNNKYLKWGIILWEILLTTLLIWYLGKIIDLIIIVTKFIDDGIRGTFRIVIVVLSTVFSCIKRIFYG